MILDENVTINGVLIMTGTPPSWFQVVPKADADIAAQTATWGSSEQGRCFFNSDTSQLELWNGSMRVILG